MLLYNSTVTFLELTVLFVCHMTFVWEIFVHFGVLFHFVFPICIILIMSYSNTFVLLVILGQIFHKCHLTEIMIYLISRGLNVLYLKISTVKYRNTIKQHNGHGWISIFLFLPPPVSKILSKSKNNHSRDPCLSIFKHLGIPWI